MPDVNPPSFAPSESPAKVLLIDIVELARLTALSVRTLRRMDASGDIPGRVVVRRCVRFQLQIIVDWIRVGLPDCKRWEEMRTRK